MSVPFSIAGAGHHQNFCGSQQVAVGHVRDSAPSPAHGPEYFPQHFLRAAIALARDASRIHVRDLGPAVADQFEQLREPGQDIERLEPGYDHRNPVALDEALENRGASDRRRVTRREKTLDAGLRHLGHDLHNRRDVLVRGKDRKVRGRLAQQHRRGRDRGGLEAAGEEDQPTVSA